MIGEEECEIQSQIIFYDRNCYEEIMSKEILKGVAEKEASRKTIINADSLIDFANEVKSGNGNEISVGGKIKIIYPRGGVQLSIGCVWKKEEDVEVLFRETHEIARVNDSKGLDNLFLLVTIEDRLKKLKKLLPNDVKMIGPADRMDDRKYKKMLSEAKKMHVEPFSEKEMPEESEIKTGRLIGEDRFKRFVRLAIEKKVKEITVEPYCYEKGKHEDGKYIKRTVFGMKIQTVLPDGEQIMVCRRNLVVPTNELAVKGRKNLIALALLVTSRYYSNKITEGLEIPTKGPVDDMDQTTRDEMDKAAGKNKIAPFPFPEFSEFQKKKRP